MSPSSSCFSFETSLSGSPVPSSCSRRDLRGSRTRRTWADCSTCPPTRRCGMPSAKRTTRSCAGRRAAPRCPAPRRTSVLTHSSPARSKSNQPPCLKPSSPDGSWMTPSSVTFALMTIFPMSILLSRRCWLPTDPDTATSGKRALADRPFSLSAGVRTGWKRDKAQEEVAEVELVGADLISRARAGDGEAFRALTEPHRRELQVHCYRMLGSFQDAEDALQDTLLAAWRGLGGFEGRASIRTWLYRIATNRCLNALRSASRRPAKEWDNPAVEPPEPTRLGEVVWLEPYPDALLDGAIDAPLGPDARYEQTEAISLAFVTALQTLPARQRAALILRDVLGYHATEVAGMLDSTVESVTSALKRARASLQRRLPPSGEREAPPAPDSPAEQELAAKFVRAYESGDVDALVALLTADVGVSMPPIPLEYQGRDAVARFYASVLRPGT